MTKQTQSTTKERVYIYMDEFDSSKLSYSIGEPQSIKDDKGKQTGSYTRITLEYAYDLPSGQYKDGLFIELPEIQTWGIQNSYNKWTMFCPLRVLKGNKEHVKIRDFLDEIRKSCELILVDAGISKKKRSRVEEEEAGEVIERSIYWQKTDKQTGAPIEGKDPGLVLRLNDKGKNATIFKGADGTTIPWNDLKDVNVTLIPMIHVSNIFMNSLMKNVQVFTVSAVVTKIESPGKMSRQIPTLENMSEETKKEFEQQYNKYKEEKSRKEDEEKSQDAEQKEDTGPSSQGETNNLDDLMEKESSN